MFGEIRSAMNGGDVVALPDDWRDDEALRGYVESYMSRNEWFVDGDITTDDEIDVRCGDLIVKNLYGDEFERLRQIAVWPIRNHTLETCFTLGVDCGYLRDLLFVQRRRYLGEQVDLYEYNRHQSVARDVERRRFRAADVHAARAVNRWCPRESLTSAAKALAHTRHPTKHDLDVKDMVAHQLAKLIDAAHNDVIALIRGAEPADIMK